MGYGIVSQFGDRLVCECYGVIRTPSSLSLTKRLSLLYDELKERAAEYPPDIIAVEKLFFGRNITTAEMVWQARELILLFAAQMGIDPYEIAVEVKLAVCGYGAAEKGQVQGMVANLLGLEKNPVPTMRQMPRHSDSRFSMSSFDRNILKDTENDQYASRQSTLDREESITLRSPDSARGLATRSLMSQAELSEELFCYAYMQISDARVSLFGFSDERERLLFFELLQVKTVGGKLAVTLLRHLDTDQILKAIASGSSAMLTVPGLGAKRAERICFELKNRIAKKFSEIAGS